MCFNNSLRKKKASEQKDYGSKKQWASSSPTFKAEEQLEKVLIEDQIIFLKLKIPFLKHFQDLLLLLLGR